MYREFFRRVIYHDVRVLSDIQEALPVQPNIFAGFSAHIFTTCSNFTFPVFAADSIYGYIFSIAAQPFGIFVKSFSPQSFSACWNGQWSVATVSMSPRLIASQRAS